MHTIHGDVTVLLSNSFKYAADILLLCAMCVRTVLPAYIVWEILAGFT